ADVPPFTDNKRQPDESNRNGYSSTTRSPLYSRTRTDPGSGKRKAWLSRSSCHSLRVCRVNSENQTRNRTVPLQTSLHGPRHGRNSEEPGHHVTTSRQILLRRRKGCRYQQGLPATRAPCKGLVRRSAYLRDERQL